MIEASYALFVVAAATVALSPVLLRSGWPLNYATPAPLLLVQMYAAHFRHLDFFPVWSSSDGDGMGSPVLLFYHRVFFYIAGAFFAVFGNLKLSVVATIFLFLVVGAYGMRCALGLVTSRRLFCTVGSLGFLFTNYVFTDWLDPRGDLAEFAGLMIVPWVLYWCLNLVKNGRVSFLLIPIMVVLVNTHSAIALTSLFCLLISLVVFWISRGWREVRVRLRRLFAMAVSIVVLLLPLLVAYYRFSQSYDPQTKNVLFFKVQQGFVDFGRYFYDDSHHWYAANQFPPLHNFVQIDLAVWIPLAAIAAVLLASRIYGFFRGGHVFWKLVTHSNRWTILFLLTSVALYLFLQLHISYFVYQLLPPLQVINWPWRMLAFITPLAILLLAVAVDSLASWYPNRTFWFVLSMGWIIALILPSPVTASVPNSYEYVIGPHSVLTRKLLAAPGEFAPLSVFQAPSSIDYRTFQGFVMIPPYWYPGPLYSVFLPKVLNRRGDEIGDDTDLYGELNKSEREGASMSHVPCRLVGPAQAPFEALELTFHVDCAGPTRVALPISFNPSSSVYLMTPRGAHQIPYYHVSTDPRIVVQVDSSHPEVMEVHLPTLWGTLF
jgi:hypothetical protein